MEGKNKVLVIAGAGVLLLLIGVLLVSMKPKTTQTVIRKDFEVEEITPFPTSEPIIIPTVRPTLIPTTIPITSPTIIPTQIPTAIPTQIPTAKPTIVVISSTGVSLNTTLAYLYTEELQQITATVEPSNTTYKKLTWTSDDKNIATVSSRGLIKAINPGETTIIVKTTNGMINQVKVMVKQNIWSTGVSLNTTSGYLYPGDRQQITTRVEPNETINKTIFWTSSDNNIASVDNNGLITANNVGVADIIARTINNKTTLVRVSVNEKPTIIPTLILTPTIIPTAAIVSPTGVGLTEVGGEITKIGLNLGNILLDLNKQQQLKVIYYPEKPIDRTITWSSSDSLIATVDSSGLVTAKDLGTAIITAKTNNNKTAITKVMVPGGTTTQGQKPTTLPIPTLTVSNSCTTWTTGTSGVRGSEHGEHYANFTSINSSTPGLCNSTYGVTIQNSNGTGSTDNKWFLWTCKGQPEDVVNCRKAGVDVEGWRLNRTSSSNSGSCTTWTTGTSGVRGSEHGEHYANFTSINSSTPGLCNSTYGVTIQNSNGTGSTDNKWFLWTCKGQPEDVVNCRKAGVDVEGWRLRNSSNVPVNNPSSTPSLTLPDTSKIVSPGTMSTQSYGGMQYVLYLPKDYNSSMEYPLLMFLHGWGENGDHATIKNTVDSLYNHKDTMLNLIKQGYGVNAIIISPWATRDWSIRSMQDQAKSILDYVSSNYSVDKSRISITGHSNGCYAVYGLVSRYPTFFSVAVPIASGAQNSTAGLTSTKIWIYYGSSDEPGTNKTNLVNDINKAGGDANISKINSGHMITKQAYIDDGALVWMINQKR